MAERVRPRYPVYVPTKGRWQPDRSLTIRCLLADDVPFRAVVEREEVEHYAPLVGEDRLLILPESGRGLFYSRNWIMDHAIEEGHARHWQLDDNIIEFRRLYRGRRIPCDAGAALRVCEDFTDRYSNVAISGLNYQMFVPAETAVPFYVNVHVYSCTLVNNAIPHRWRLLYNDDTDLCLQALSDGWCTILLNVFMANKMRTMVIGGGNTDDLYQGDGRLTMARSLERAWPGTVETSRRFGRPQHVIRDQWGKFDTPLRLRDDVDFSAMPRRDEYGMELRQVREVESSRLRGLVDEFAKEEDDVQEVEEEQAEGKWPDARINAMSTERRHLWGAERVAWVYRELGFEAVKIEQRGEMWMLDVGDRSMVVKVFAQMPDEREGLQGWDPKIHKKLEDIQQETRMPVVPHVVWMDAEGKPVVRARRVDLLGNPRKDVMGRTGRRWLWDPDFDLRPLGEALAELSQPIPVQELLF